MALKLLDQISLPGDAAHANEDAFAHGPDAAVVFDGATPLGPPLLPGASDAAWIARFGSRRLMAHLADGDAAGDALAHALADTKKSFDGLARRPIAEKWQTPCAAMMLVTQTAKALEFLWFGDCTALVLTGVACETIGDGFDKRGQEAARARKVDRPTTAAGIDRSEFLPVLRAARNHINSGGNWLFSPEPKAAAHVSRRTVNAAPGSMLLLGSDGFLALATDYGRYDAMGLMTAARGKGLAALGEELRGVERDDPRGEIFPRFKTSDDATALLLEVV